MDLSVSFSLSLRSVYTKGSMRRRSRFGDREYALYAFILRQFSIEIELVLNEMLVISGYIG